MLIAIEIAIIPLTIHLHCGNLVDTIIDRSVMPCINVTVHYPTGHHALSFFLFLHNTSGAIGISIKCDMVISLTQTSFMSFMSIDVSGRFLS